MIVKWVIIWLCLLLQAFLWLLLNDCCYKWTLQSLTESIKLNGFFFLPETISKHQKLAKKCWKLQSSDHKMLQMIVNTSRFPRAQNVITWPWELPILVSILYCERTKYLIITSYTVHDCWVKIWRIFNFFKKNNNLIFKFAIKH